MIGGWLPWRRLLAVWLPPVVLCLAMAGLYLWQSSGTVGREAQLRDRVSELEASLRRLDRVSVSAAADLATVSKLDEELQRIYVEVFGSLDTRLTDILREIEAATRGAQMLPEGFTYRADSDKELDCVNFGIGFIVSGQYEQIRRMLAAIQSSPEFLIVEGITFRGEEEPTSQQIQISVRLATYLATANPERLRLLTAVAGAEGAVDGAAE